MTDDAVQTPMTFTYKNWRGEVATRTALPVGTLERKATEFHPEPQWIMRAWDYEKQAYRDFALADCTFASATPESATRERISGIVNTAIIEALADYEVPSDMIANDPEIATASDATADFILRAIAQGGGQDG